MAIPETKWTDPIIVTYSPDPAPLENADEEKAAHSNFDHRRLEKAMFGCEKYFDSEDSNASFEKVDEPLLSSIRRVVERTLYLKLDEIAKLKNAGDPGHRPPIMLRN